MDSTPKQSAQEIVKGIGDSLAEPVQNMKERWRNDFTSNLGKRKATVAESIGAVAETMRDVTSKLEENGNPTLGSYVGYGQEAVDRLSGYLNEKEVRDIARDMTAYAHRNPTLVVGGLFALGFAAGRFLRSSAPEPQTKALAIPGQAPPWR